MSPEQARGAGVDFRSDIFSFGTILYELATGHQPFARPTKIETLTAILHVDPPPIQELNDRAPLPLQWIVQRCLAKDLRERYAATADLHHDLCALRERLPTIIAGPSERRSPARPTQSQASPRLRAHLSPRDGSRTDVVDDAYARRRQLGDASLSPVCD